MYSLYFNNKAPHIEEVLLELNLDFLHLQRPSCMNIWTYVILWLLAIVFTMTLGLPVKEAWVYTDLEKDVA